MVERGTQVVILGRRLRETRSNRSPCATPRAKVVLGVPTAHRVGLLTLLEEFARVLADRLQHPVAVVAATEKTLVDERRNRVEVGSADLLSRLEGEAAGEDCELANVPVRPAAGVRSSRRWSRASVL